MEVIEFLLYSTFLTALRPTSVRSAVVVGSFPTGPLLSLLTVSVLLIQCCLADEMVKALTSVC